MKKRLLALASLMLIVVCASSGYAFPSAVFDLSGNPTILGVAGTDAYIKGDEVNLTFGSVGNPAAPGTGQVSLAVSFQLASDWSTTLSLKPKFWTVGDPDLYKQAYSGKANDIISFTTNITTQPTGIYAFTMFSTATGSSNPADWRLLTATISNSAPATTPIPAAFLLLGSGLVGLFGVKRVRRGNAAA